jgi:hypothetical protein
VENYSEIRERNDLLLSRDFFRRAAVGVRDQAFNDFEGDPNIKRSPDNLAPICARAASAQQRLHKIRVALGD